MDGFVTKSTVVYLTPFKSLFQIAAVSWLDLCLLNATEMVVAVASLIMVELNAISANQHCFMHSQNANVSYAMLPSYQKPTEFFSYSELF